MEKKRMTLAQAEAQLLNKGCTFKDHNFTGSTISPYRVVTVPRGVLLYPSCHAAMERMRRHMLTIYMFRSGKREKRSQ